MNFATLRWLCSLVICKAAMPAPPSSGHSSDAFGCYAGYGEFVGKLISALQDAIEADLSDMEERQVPSLN